MLGRIFIGAVVIGSLWFSFASGTKPSIPSLKMEMAIINDGKWEVGKENTVSFKFKPLEEVPHKTKLPDEATITFDSGLVLVSGSPTWLGFLKKGTEYSVLVTLKPTKAGRFWITGDVISCLTKIRTEEEMAIKQKERQETLKGSPLGGKIEKGDVAKKIYRYYNATADHIDVKGQAELDTTLQQINGAKIKGGPPLRIPAKTKIPNVPPDSLKKIKEDTTKYNGEIKELQVCRPTLSSTWEISYP